MKRKFKLISSILSLTLSVSFFVVGVSAATTRNIDVAGTISFSTQSVAATVTVFQKLGSEAEQTVHTLTFTPGGNQTGETINLGYGTPKEIEMSESVTTYVVRVTIKNDFTVSPRVFEVYSSSLVNNATLQANGITLTTSGASSGDSVASGNTLTYIFTYELDPLTAPKFFSSQLVKLSFELLRMQ